MSTTYHTAISTGAAANAATINTPLGTLDAAIDTVNDRIDTLIAESGTSDAEVVDSRAGYTVLDNRLDDMVQRSAIFYVDPAFTNNATTRRYATIGGAMAAAAAGDTIYVAPGVYSETVTFSQNDVKLIGAGAGQFNSASSTFGPGTIVNGTISLNGKSRCLVADLTVNVTGSVADGIIDGTTTASAAKYHEIRNCVVVGNGPSAAVHGILLQNGSNSAVRNCRVYRIGHGIAVRAAHTIVSDCYIENCGLSAVIVKSASGSGDTSWVDIVNVVVNLGVGLIIESADASYATRHINVVNLVGFYNSSPTINVYETAGTIEHVSFTNCQSQSCQDGSSGAIQVASGADISFVNCAVGYAAGVSFKNVAGERVQLVGCRSRNGGGAVLSGAFAEIGVNGASWRGAAAATGSVFSVANNSWTSITGFSAVADYMGQVTTGYISIPITGIYRLKARIPYAANGTGVRGGRFYDIVAAVAYGECVTLSLTTGHETVRDVEVVVSLNAGTGIILQGYQNSGGALNAAAGVQLSMELLQVS